MKPSAQIRVARSILSACDVQIEPDSPIEVEEGSVTVWCRGLARGAARRLAAYYASLKPEVVEFWDRTIEVLISPDSWRGISVSPSGGRLCISFFHHR